MTIFKIDIFIIVPTSAAILSNPVWVQFSSIKMKTDN